MASLDPAKRTWTVAAALLLVGLAACEREQARPPAPAAQAPAPPPEPPAQTGVASYYGPGFAGEKTASGERHDPKDLTAASRTLPLGTTAKVTNTETGKSVSVEINDRGPYARNRIIDLSERAAKRLGMKEDGTARVKVQPKSVPREGDGDR
jgi:rare lipoprotein A